MWHLAQSHLQRTRETGAGVIGKKWDYLKNLRFAGAMLKSFITFRTNRIWALNCSVRLHYSGLYFCCLFVEFNCRPQGEPWSLDTYRYIKKTFARQAVWSKIPILDCRYYPKWTAPKSIAVGSAVKCLAPKPFGSVFAWPQTWSAAFRIPGVAPAWISIKASLILRWQLFQGTASGIFKTGPSWIYGQKLQSIHLVCVCLI